MARGCHAAQAADRLSGGRASDGRPLDVGGAARPAIAQHVHARRGHAGAGGGLGHHGGRGGAGDLGRRDRLSHRRRPLVARASGDRLPPGALCARRRSARAGAGAQGAGSSVRRPGRAAGARAAAARRSPGIPGLPAGPQQPGRYPAPDLAIQVFLRHVVLRRGGGGLARGGTACLPPAADRRPAGGALAHARRGPGAGRDLRRAGCYQCRRAADGTPVRRHPAPRRGEGAPAAAGVQRPLVPGDRRPCMARQPHRDP